MVLERRQNQYLTQPETFPVRVSIECVQGAEANLHRQHTISLLSD